MGIAEGSRGQPAVCPGPAGAAAGAPPFQVKLAVRRIADRCRGPTPVRKHSDACCNIPEIKIMICVAFRASGSQRFRRGVERLRRGFRFFALALSGSVMVLSGSVVVLIGCVVVLNGFGVALRDSFVVLHGCAMIQMAPRWFFMIPSWF